jgi:glucosamine--fructose-6-phosphate aminotransferase (isomerizing)
VREEFEGRCSIQLSYGREATILREMNDGWKFRNRCGTIPPLMPEQPQPPKTSAAPVFAHSMLREIYEQPHAIRETISRNTADGAIFPAALQPIEGALSAFKKIIIVASGSSRHAGLAGEIMLEDLANVSVDVEYSSEYCYRSTHADHKPIVVVITQSGETADTIAAQREALRRGAKTVAISNVADATIVREASAALLTYAGIERAVPATKSFTAQLTLLYLLALFLARKRGGMAPEVAATHLRSLLELPAGIEASVDVWNTQAEQCARRYQHAKTLMFLGRGVHYAIAREGALKLKEISYVQAEGLPAGELRHGPNALVDDKLPIVVLATRDLSDPGSMLRYQKTLAILEYVKSRGGKAIAIAVAADREEVASLADRVITVPVASELLLPILEVVPLQLFAYHFAVLNGANVDNPRNLVKAVISE